MVYDVDLVRRGPLRVEEMVSQNLVMPGRRRFVDPDHCELFFIEVLCILGCFLAWLWCPPGFR
jgi:hypothetical protein